MFKHTDRQNRWKKLLVVAVAAVLMLSAVGASVAYVHSKTPAVSNSFALATVSCELQETVEDGVKKSVTVKNNGGEAVYIRAAVIANSVDEEGGITGDADVSACLCGTKWVKHTDGFFYFTEAVKANASTENLLKSDIDLTGIQVTILTEAIQANPVDAAVDAWGVKPATLAN